MKRHFSDWLRNWNKPGPGLIENPPSIAALSEVTISRSTSQSTYLGERQPGVTDPVMYPANLAESGNYAAAARCPQYTPVYDRGLQRVGGVGGDIRRRGCNQATHHGYGVDVPADRVA